LSWTISIGRVSGTVVKVHWTFLLFLAWIAIAFYFQGGAAAAAGGVMFLLLLFVCVLLHEFGHILTARYFGVRTPDVILLPIGGMSRMERIPDEPRQELLIAIAGPAVSLAIALVLILVLGGLPNPLDIWPENPGRSMLAQLAWANLMLLAFNLVPAFPMDGGRVLRAILSSRFGHAKGTRIAAGIGQALAIAIGLAALFAGQILLALIALFIYFAAGAEAGLSRMHNVTHGLAAADVMITDYVALPADAPVSDAAEALIRTSQREFPVIDGAGRLRGFLTRDGIIKALRQSGPDTPVSEAMQDNIPSIPARHHVEEAVQHLEQGAPAVAVTGAAGQIVGFITWENLIEQQMISTARG
jgi:Zn-dependent protease/CBS domain-containing protein